MANVYYSTFLNVFLKFLQRLFYVLTFFHFSWNVFYIYGLYQYHCAYSRRTRPRRLEMEYVKLSLQAAADTRTLGLEAFLAYRTLRT